MTRTVLLSLEKWWMGCVTAKTIGSKATPIESAKKVCLINYPQKLKKLKIFVLATLQFTLNCMDNDWCKALGSYAYCNATDHCECVSQAVLNETTFYCDLRNDSDLSQICLSDADCPLYETCQNEQCQCTEGFFRPNDTALCSPSKLRLFRNLVTDWYCWLTQKLDRLARCEIVAISKTPCVPTTKFAPVKVTATWQTITSVSKVSTFLDKYLTILYHDWFLAAINLHDECVINLQCKLVPNSDCLTVDNSTMNCLCSDGFLEINETCYARKGL